MKKVCNLALLLAVTLLNCSLFAEDSAPVVTQWTDQYQQYVPEAAPKSFVGAESISIQDGLMNAMDTSEGGATGGVRIALVVEESLLNSIENDINIYRDALIEQGYGAVVISFAGSAETLRWVLQEEYNQPASLDGAIFIGNLPYVTFEMSNSFGSYDSFPCDMYFMDMDGSFNDSNNNNKYDIWNGPSGNTDSHEIELWVSRIKADNLTQLESDESTLISEYIQKNLRLRNNLLNSSFNGIVYNDDDWDYMANGDQNNLKNMFGEDKVYTYNLTEETTATHFKNTAMKGEHHFVFIRSHGTASGHGFYKNNKSTFEMVYNYNYKDINPKAVFYSLYVCSGCRFTSANNLGLMTVMNPYANGLTTWGTTKTGGMWKDNYFYQPLVQGKSIGQSFRDWFNNYLIQNTQNADAWWWGMVILGDGSVGMEAGPAYVSANDDTNVDLQDWALLSNEYGKTGENLKCDIYPMPLGDGKVDQDDMSLLLSHWLERAPENL